MVVEQIEVIEHRIIEEGRRPSGGALLLPPYSSIRESRESYEQRADGVIHDRRFEVTGERDVSREPSFLHSSANYGQHIELSPPSQRYNISGSTIHNHNNSSSFLNTTEESRWNGMDRSGGDSTIINNYGYDVHEINTTEGGARIIETHGSGPPPPPPLRETSRIEHVEETVIRPSAMKSQRSSSNIFTVPTPNLNTSFRQDFTSDPESLARKDSYRAMQSSWDGDAKVQRFQPVSQASLVSRETPAYEEKQIGCWQKTRMFFEDLIYAFRNSEYSPALMRSLCCILLLLLLLLILLYILFVALFNPYSVSEFLVFPPVCEECRRKNPALVSAALPSSVFVHFFSKNQAQFELRGNAPFKSNSFTAVDFTTGYVAIADHALTDAQGKHTTCFLMPLDRSAIENIDQLSEAVADSDFEIQSTYGWQEFWQFDPEPIEPITANSKFTERIDDCANAKWYLLRQTVHARDVSCSDCYDFCLPDWAVVRKEKYDDQSTLGVRRLNCFRLYVPEWRNFRVETDVGGGHWKYPLSSESTKRDKNGHWVSWLPTVQSEGLSRTRKSITSS